MASQPDPDRIPGGAPTPGIPTELPIDVPPPMSDTPPPVDAWETEGNMQKGGHYERAPSEEKGIAGTVCGAGRE